MKVKTSANDYSVFTLHKDMELMEWVNVELCLSSSSNTACQRALYCNSPNQWGCFFASLHKGTYCLEALMWNWESHLKSHFVLMCYKIRIFSVWKPSMDIVDICNNTSTVYQKIAKRPKLSSCHFLLEQSIIFFREGNGTPLQYSCLENPMDGGAW